MTEASAIEKYAVENNLIDPKHIIKEEQASSTAENSYYSRIIIDQFGASNVHVVTTQLHMERAKKFFERVCSCHFVHKCDSAFINRLPGWPALWEGSHVLSKYRLLRRSLTKYTAYSCCSELEDLPLIRSRL